MPVDQEPSPPDLHDAPVLVTGAAGFIGRAVADRLLTDGRRVVAADIIAGVPDPALAKARLKTLLARPSFSLERIDLADRIAAADLFSRVKPRHVIHLAARAGVRASMQEPYVFARANLDGFLNVLEGCTSTAVEHLVYASSSSVYGAGAQAPFREDTTGTPLSLYGATKGANELMAAAYSHYHGFSTTGLRFFTVYGPWGRPDMAVLSFARAIMAGTPITLYDGGTPLRDFTFIDDVVEATVRLAGLPPGTGGAPRHRIVNVGKRHPDQVRDLVRLLEEALGRKAVIEEAPLPASDVPMTCADTARLQELTGFQPQVPLAEGVARFAEWFRAYEGR